ncbi:hypothetical protein QCA50_005436 [Cerrena zonata]|uniref:Uncharacterized protein n=1 Tax=Cerrena zonata TaxID=2478898 RepID=A0AAW0GF87_9APHY
MSHNPGSAASGTGASLGQKVRGAFETAHGLGESIRGGAMDFVDSATGTGDRHQETQKGAREVEEGISKIEHGNNYKAAPTVTGVTTAGKQTGPATQAGATNPHNNTAVPVQNAPTGLGIAPR